VRRVTTYRILCGAIGAALSLLGAGLFVGFFRYHGPGGEAPGPIPVGPGGVYYMAFLGSALVAWGGCLLGAARRPEIAPWIGTATAVGLVMAAIHRIHAWLVGDYANLGNLPRIEAAIVLLCALALIWLKPGHSTAVTPEAP